MASNTPISQALSHVSGQMAEYAMLGEGSQVLSEIENEHHFLSEFGESIVRAAIGKLFSYAQSYYTIHVILL